MKMKEARKEASSKSPILAPREDLGVSLEAFVAKMTPKMPQSSSKMAVFNKEPARPPCLIPGEAVFPEGELPSASVGPRRASSGPKNS